MNKKCVNTKEHIRIDERKILFISFLNSRKMNYRSKVSRNKLFLKLHSLDKMFQIILIFEKKKYYLLNRMFQIIFIFEKILFVI